ncbi:MAG TPA: hypothetical protein VH188_07925 [Chthoniobacterales bacterium]|jgi:hypothetical protein|nr:hypothetical protein [Chthoniobacterales bacterium]
MKNATKTKTWDAMSNDEKLDRLTSVLTRAGSDIEFRDRCLGSAESAKQAVSEAGEIEFPSDFEIQFLTSEQRMKKLVLAVPDFIPLQSGQAEERNAEDYQTCTYHIWRS